MNILTIEEILEIYSYLRHLQINICLDEKMRIENILEKLKLILLDPPMTLPSIQEDETVLVNKMKCKVLREILYDDVENSDSKQEVLVTILQDHENECFRITIDDSHETPFEVEVDEIDLSIEEKKIVCHQEDSESFELFLEPDFIETLTLILNSNCNSSNL